MKIKADKEGVNVIKGLCDVALKTAGIQNLEVVNSIIDGLEELPEPKKDFDKKK